MAPTDFPHLKLLLIGFRSCYILMVLLTVGKTKIFKWKESKNMNLVVLHMIGFKEGVWRCVAEIEVQDSLSQNKLLCGSVRWPGMLSWTEPWHGQLLSVWGFFTGVCSGSVWVSQVFLLFVWHSGRIDLSSCTAEHKHEFSWLCLSLCVYVANCKMTCCCIQREDLRASPVHPRLRAET